MIAEFVLFDARGDMSSEEIGASMHKVTPKWRAKPRAQDIRLRPRVAEGGSRLFLACEI